MKTYFLFLLIVVLSHAQKFGSDTNEDWSKENTKDNYKRPSRNSTNYVEKIKVLIDDDTLIDKVRLPNASIFNKQFFSVDITNLIQNLSGVLLKEIEAIPNEKCQHQLITIQNEILSGIFKEWLLQLIDASFKLNSGILELNLGDFGNPQECLQLSERFSDSDVIEGKYCIISGALTNFEFLRESKKYGKFADFIMTNEERELLMSTKVFGGVCIPSACSATALNPLFKSVVDHLLAFIKSRFDRDIPMTIILREEQCYDGKPGNLSIMNITCISLFIFLICILVLSTYYDVSKQGQDIPFVIKSFSLRQTSKKLFSIESSDRCLTCLNGVRVLSMCLIVYGHEVLIMRSAPLKNNLDAMYFGNSSTIGIMGFYAVETFFLLSGMLVVYIFFMYKNSKTQAISFVDMYITRYIRLAPTLGLTILITINASIMCHYNLPTYCTTYFLTKKIEHCETNWWLTLLFLQNYVDPDHMCIRPSWYLAVDTQLFILSPILLFGLKYKKKMTLLVSVLAICAVSLANGILTYKWDLLSLMPINQWTWELYRATHLRFFSWLVGALFGYIMAYYQKENKKLPKIAVIASWIFVSVVLIGILVYTQERTLKFDIGPVEASIVNATLRQLWSVGVSLMIFLCSIGSGGLVNKFLSLPVFIITGRLTFSMYLFHIYVMLYYRIGKMNVDYFNDWEIVHNFLADLMVTLLLSVISTLSIEMPFASLGQMLLKIARNKKKTTESNVVVPAEIFGKINPIFDLNNKNINIPK